MAEKWPEKWPDSQNLGDFLAVRPFFGHLWLPEIFRPFSHSVAGQPSLKSKARHNPEPRNEV